MLLNVRLRLPLGVVARAVDELGGLDLVVHAAGAGFTPKPVGDVTESDLDAALDVTAKGTFFLAQAAAVALRESHGVLVIVEDVASFQPWISFAPHSAAKAAQAMLTRVFARALAPEVRVCGIAPGRWRSTPARRSAAQPKPCSGASVLRRTSRRRWSTWRGADYVTGTTLVVDGGRLLKSGRASIP